MNAATGIAVSGMSAAAFSLSASASNLANAQTQAPLPAGGQTSVQTQPSPYQPVTVSDTAALGGGVSATTIPQVPASTLAYDPSSPFANLQGMVAEPNVDPDNEIVNEMSAALAYKANLISFKTAEDTEKTLLDAIA